MLEESSLPLKPSTFALLCRCARRRIQSNTFRVYLPNIRKCIQSHSKQLGFFLPPLTPSGDFSAAYNPLLSFCFLHSTVPVNRNCKVLKNVCSLILFSHAANESWEQISIAVKQSLGSVTSYHPFLFSSHRSIK